MPRRKRHRSRIVRFVKKHPTFSVAVLIGVLAGFGIDRWLDVTERTQGIVTLAVFGVVLLVKLFLGIGYGKIYRYWTYVHEDMDLPRDQRRIDYNGYIGKTRQRNNYRHRQHLGKSTRYPDPASPWSDLIANPGGLPETLHESEWMTDLGLHLRELIRIKIHRPLYNDRMNRYRYRIPREVAREQRAERDEWRLAG